MALIQNKLACARKAMDVRIIPKDADDEMVHKYLNGVMGILSGYTFLEQDWWKRTRLAYGVPDKVSMIRFDGDRTVTYEVPQ